MASDTIKVSVHYNFMQKRILMKESEDILEKIKLAFSNCLGGFPEHFFLQIYDEDFQEYVDLEQNTVIGNLSKLKVVAFEQSNVSVENNEF